MSEAVFPHIRFDWHSVENREESIKTGLYVQKDVLYAFVTRPGQRDTLVKDAHQYAKDLVEAARGGRIPQEWPAHYSKMLDTWKSGQELPVSGTPIKGWPLVPPSAQNMLIQAGIRTVEELATMPEGDMLNVGMGAISFRQKAVAYLKTAETGKAVEQLAAMQVKIDEMARIIEEQARAMQEKPVTVGDRIAAKA